MRGSHWKMTVMFALAILLPSMVSGNPPTVIITTPQQAAAYDVGAVFNLQCAVDADPGLAADDEMHPTGSINYRVTTGIAPVSILVDLWMRVGDDDDDANPIEVKKEGNMLTVVKRNDPWNVGAAQINVRFYTNETPPQLVNASVGIAFVE